MTEHADEFTDVLGAYALDAVDDDERERIERHLAECPRCRAEVAEHREVASFLAQSGADAPAGVWDKIAAELSPPAPPMRLTLSPLAPEPAQPAPPAAPVAEPEAEVVPLAPRRSARSGNVRTRTFAAVLAAAAVVVAVLGFVSVDKSRQLDRVESAMNELSIEQRALETAATADLKVDLTGDAGRAQAAVDDDGHGYLITKGMPAPAEGELYQLWGVVDDVVLSLGTFGGEADVVPFNLDPGRLDDVSAFAVTQEKAPGVLASGNPALMAGEV